MAVSLPALRYEAEGFQLGPEQILGRQSAGEAFLRAALSLPGLSEIHGYGPNAASAEIFGRTIRDAAPYVVAKWLPLNGLEGLQQIGAVHFPDPALVEPARTRLARGANAWSISGITHTIASQGVMQQLASYPAAPLMEWDGLICTSDAVKASVLEIIEEQEASLAWRLPGGKPPPRLQLPVIALGAHCADFEHSDVPRAGAAAGQHPTVTVLLATMMLKLGVLEYAG